jgi:sugar fermentation stimulation protein A
VTDPRPKRQHAKLLRRYKRFLADVELPGGEELTVHCPNPGRLLSVVEEGQDALIRDSENPKRKLRWTLEALKVHGIWIYVDTMASNGAVEAAILSGKIPELSGYESLRREVPYGENSRIDLLLEDPAKGVCYVEVKTTTYLDDTVARFPDAVTARGLKHLKELTKLALEGTRAVCFFLVTRDDALSFGPAPKIDPAWAAAYEEARVAGVDVIAYDSRVNAGAIEMGVSLAVQKPLGA